MNFPFNQKFIRDTVFLVTLFYTYIKSIFLSTVILSKDRQRTLRPVLEIFTYYSKKKTITSHMASQAFSRHWAGSGGLDQSKTKGQVASSGQEVKKRDTNNPIIFS